ncbi:neuropeptides capa receptor-like [Parasteatoda tepidariorum]|uniref:neuropeptides capa receptor-like n=1 Tax=Parasteatoda tepidariorum TaxID=114398 RepID=UPI001C71AC5C|nr:neuropeptides capa receptor-like [Parasteatoda tepidariorum]
MPFNMSAWNETLVDSIDIEDYVTKSLGPKRLALNWLIPLTVVYSLIFLSGIVGNVCTCVVIGRNQYMQTATNCYLFNLAIADMMTLLFAMPMELYTLWEQYPWHLGLIGCWMRSLIPETTAYASILTIVVFSTERYIAICHPIRQQTKAKLSSAIRNIAIVWLVSIVCALPFAYYAKVNYVTLPDGQLVEEASWCGLSFVEGNEVWIYAMGFSTIVFFIIPFVLIIVMYVFIWLALRRSHRMHRSTSESAQCRLERERSKAQSRRVVIRMLVAVVAGFFLCWAPFHAQRLLFVIVTSYSEWTETLRNVNHNLFTLAGISILTFLLP